MLWLTNILIRKHEIYGWKMNFKRGFNTFWVLLLVLNLFCYSNTGEPCKKKISISGQDIGSKENPVRCHMEEGEREYLERLRDLSGNTVQFRRIGHAHPDTKGHILDKFEIKSADNSICTEIYMDMYWPNHVETNPIKGFEIARRTKPKKKKVKRFVPKTPKTKPYIPRQKYNVTTSAMSAANVYRMIRENGFYCEVMTGSGFHGEALKNIIKPKNGIFRDQRFVSATKQKNDLIKTRSVNRLNRSDKITLLWSPKPQLYTFREAVDHIENLKQTGKEEHWRIPTIKELFSIVREDTGNHFPAAFKIPHKKSLVFWTSTAVIKEGTAIEYDRANKAYFVVRCKYSKSSGNYSVNFSFEDIEGLKARKAYLLPVLSEKVYDYQLAVAKKPSALTPSSASGSAKPDRIPGFDDLDTHASTPIPATPAPSPKSKIPPPTTKPQKQTASDKIPGFDDKPAFPGFSNPPGKKTTPATSKTPNVSIPAAVPGINSITGNTKKSPATSQSSKPVPAVKVALFPLMWKGQLNQKQEQFLNDLITILGNELKTLGKQVMKGQGVSLGINKNNSFTRSNTASITTLYSILSNTNIKDILKLDSLKSAIMKPLGVDIIVTVQHNQGPSNLDVFKLTIIDGLNNKIYSKGFVQNSVSGRFKTLNSFIKNTVADIIKNKFK